MFEHQNYTLLHESPKVSCYQFIINNQKGHKRFKIKHFKNVKVHELIHERGDNVLIYRAYGLTL
jgi:hypothetical protein